LCIAVFVQASWQMLAPRGDRTFAQHQSTPRQRSRSRAPARYPLAQDQSPSRRSIEQWLAATFGCTMTYRSPLVFLDRDSLCAARAQVAMRPVQDFDSQMSH